MWSIRLERIYILHVSPSRAILVLYIRKSLSWYSHAFSSWPIRRSSILSFNSSLISTSLGVGWYIVNAYVVVSTKKKQQAKKLTTNTQYMAVVQFGFMYYYQIQWRHSTNLLAFFNAIAGIYSLLKRVLIKKITYMLIREMGVEKI